MRDPPVSCRFPRRARSSACRLHVAAMRHTRVRVHPHHKGAGRQRRSDSAGPKPTAPPPLSEPRPLVPCLKPPLIPGLKPRATAVVATGKRWPHATSARLSQCQLVIASSFLSGRCRSPHRSRASPSLPQRSLELGLLD
jgi:hypothetical protein